MEIKQIISFFLDLLSDVLVELVPGDLGPAEPGHVVDHLLQLLLTQVILHLLRDALQVPKSEGSLVLGVDQVEHGLPAVDVKGVALHKQNSTSLSVMRVRKVSKSIQVPLSSSTIEVRAWQMILYFLSKPSVRAVLRMSAKSHCLLGSQQRLNISQNSSMCSRVKMGFLVTIYFRYRAFFSRSISYFFWVPSILKYNDIGSDQQIYDSFVQQQNIYYQLEAYIMLYSGNKFASPFQSSSKKKKKDIDRFIPHSVTKNLYSLFDEVSSSMAKNKRYESILEQNLRGTSYVGKVLSFTEQRQDKQNLMNMQNLSSTNKPLFQPKPKKSTIKYEPYKVLEAPCLRDDFYLNLVDWSDSDNIGVGLQSSLYIWSGCTSKVRKVYESQNPTDYLCSVAFLKHSNKVSVGFTDGSVKIFDLEVPRNSVQFEGLHLGRIGSLGCSHNLICTGGRDGFVSIQDLRMEKQVMRYKAHNQQICGLKLNPGSDIIATGGNDNKLVLFSLKKMSKLVSWDNHNAAVKAIGFNPNQPTVTSGAGIADRKLRVFSLNTLKMLNQVDTGSQVCNLLYSPVSNELVTTHGYSLNQINLWRCGPGGSLQKVDSMMGHRSRVLYLAGEGAGSKIVTGAGDQELRLWKVFSQKNQPEVIDDLR